MPHCTVCENFRPSELDSERPLVEMRLEGRTVVLCSGHARIAENSGVRTFAGLRGLYGNGRRSYVPRRAGEEAASDAERRRGPGRRATDVAF
jgi:hypothetical protein